LAGLRGELRSKSNDYGILADAFPGALVFGVALALLGSACGARQKNGKEEGSVGHIATDPNLAERAPCVTPERTVNTVDVDGDGQPNVRHALEGGRRVCTELDLNFDAKMDMTRFYEDDGETPKREEYDYDFDGLV